MNKVTTKVIAEVREDLLKRINYTSELSAWLRVAGPKRIQMLAEAVGTMPNTLYIIASGLRSNITLARALRITKAIANINSISKAPLPEVTLTNLAIPADVAERTRLALSGIYLEPGDETLFAGYEKRKSAIARDI